MGSRGGTGTGDGGSWVGGRETRSVNGVVRRMRVIEVPPRERAGGVPGGSGDGPPPHFSPPTHQSRGPSSAAPVPTRLFAKGRPAPGGGRRPSPGPRGVPREWLSPMRTLLRLLLTTLLAGAVLWVTLPLAASTLARGAVVAAGLEERT